MLSRRIIPCLDVAGGRVVKGVNFVDLRDQGDPVECAARYDADGADEIVFLDITATHEARGSMLDVIARTAEVTFTPLTVGGGVREIADIERLLSAGADKVAMNSAALANPMLVKEASERWGAQAIVVAIDAKRGPGPVGAATGANDAPCWDVYSHGGRKKTTKAAVDWAVECARLGAGEILLTSMDRDGTKVGYDIALVRAVTSAVDIPVIASGGVGTLEHLYAGLAEGGASAVLAASIFHEGKHTIAEAKAYLAARGVPVRIVHEQAVAS